MGLIINEWLPNPAGDDAKGEWIEIYNPDNQPQQIFEYKIVNGAGKKYVFGDRVIGSQEYFLLPRPVSRLTLRNKDEVLELYDPNGELLDKSRFIGTAPEGKSFGRIGKREIFQIPTPGAINQSPPIETSSTAYLYGVPLGAEHAGINVAVAVLLLGIGLSCAITTIIVRNENLSDLFFN
ncbi:MAG: lamin tail domain-containing protein [Candidatus Liptonbacteria bacterium]